MDLREQSLSQEEARQLKSPSVGGVILFTRNFSGSRQIAELIEHIRALRSEILIAVDTEGGRVQRFRQGFLKLPAMARYGELAKTDLDAALQAAQIGGWLLAAELRAIDVDLAFAPVLDIDTGVSGVIGDRAIAQDSRVVTALAAAFNRGMQAAGMATTGKHFPGHGFVAPDSHVEMPIDERSLADINACDLIPYQELSRLGLLDSVMIAHVCYPRIDDKPASISRHWIQQQLRGKLQYQGAVFSDDLSMGGLAQYGDACSRVQLALDAGCDMLPVCNQPQDLQQLLQARDWVLSDEAIQRLQRLKRPRQWNSLQQLRDSVEYANNINKINNNIQIKIEPDASPD